MGDYLEMASMGSLGGAAYQILLQSKLVITALMCPGSFSFGSEALRMWGIKGTKQTALQWNILILAALFNSYIKFIYYMLKDVKGGLSNTAS